MNGAAHELDLVRKALLSGLSNCVIWVNDKQMAVVRNNPTNRGLTPAGIKAMLLEFVRENGPGVVEQRPEMREGWRDYYAYYYRVIINPLADFPRGLFVEMVLADEDEEVPVVALVNAHPQN